MRGLQRHAGLRLDLRCEPVSDLRHGTERGHVRDELSIRDDVQRARAMPLHQRELPERVLYEWSWQRGDLPAQLGYDVWCQRRRMRSLPDWVRLWRCLRCLCLRQQFAASVQRRLLRSRRDLLRRPVPDERLLRARCAVQRAVSMLPRTRQYLRTRRHLPGRVPERGGLPHFLRRQRLAVRRQR